MDNIGYEVDGTVVWTLKELAPLLNVARVTAKDVEKGGKYADMVSLVDLEALAEEESNKDSKKDTSGVKKSGKKTSNKSTSDNEEDDEAWENEKLKVDSKEESHPMESDIDPDEIYSTVDDDEVDISKDEILETLPKFKDLEELKEFIKDLDTPTLEYFAKGLELTWTPTYHANIHRMRIAMAMHRYFFPEMFQPKEPKKKARFSDMSTDELVKQAKEVDKNLEVTKNDRINRMKAIMVLSHKEEATAE